MKTPCQECDHRLIGCHGLCPEYKAWKTEWEKLKAAKPKRSELSQSMKKLLRRRMLGR